MDLVIFLRNKSNEMSPGSHSEGCVGGLIVKSAYGMVSGLCGRQLSLTVTQF